MHKTLINGTEYDVTGGKALIGGTSYTISKGRTLVGGTGYDISFGTWTDRFVRLMQNATLVTSAGRNTSSGSNTLWVSFSSIASGTYYVFSIYNGNIGITRIVWDGSSFTDTTLLYASYDGERYTRSIVEAASPTLYLAYYDKTLQRYTRDTPYGAGLFVFSVTGYLETNIDNILSQFLIQNVAYRDAASTAVVRVADTTTNALLVQYNNYIGLSYPYGTVILGNNTANPSLLRQNGGYYNVSSNGTSNTSVYGANIIEL